MASCAVLALMTSSLQWVKARSCCAILGMTNGTSWVKESVRGDVYSPSNRTGHARRGSNSGGLIVCSQFIRSVIYNHGEDAFSLSSTRKRERSGSNHTAHKILRDGSTLHKAVTKLIDRVSRGFSFNSYAYNHILKWCSEEKDLESVKQVHASIKGSRMEQHPYVANMLLKCYIECGGLETAWEIFNGPMKKDTVSWNMMISVCVKRDKVDDAIELYNNMRNEGVQPDVITFLSVLKACVYPRMFDWGRQIHALITRDGLEGDVRISNALVHMYAKSGSIEDARSIFDGLIVRDVRSWNVMIGGLAQHGLGREAFSLFLQMQKEGFTPDTVTYLNILNPNSSTRATEWVKEVHAHAVEAGFDVDVQVGTALVQMFAKSGNIEDAKAVFGKMERRNVWSWNVMIGGLAELGFGLEAFSFFIQLQREGFTPDAITYLNILNPCSSTGALEWVKEVHSHATRAGLDVDIQVGNALVHMYAKSGSIEDARVVFGKLVRRDVPSWNAIIGGLSEHGLGHEAFSLFLQMQREGFTPDAVTYLSILNPSSSTGATEWVREVHANALEAGLDVDVQVGTALVQMYAKSGSIVDARAVFARLRRRDVRSWNVIIDGLVEHGLGHEAFSLFLQMQREGFTPDPFTYLSILNPCSSAGAEEWVRNVHAYATEANFDVDMQVGTALVQMYAKIGLIADAKRVFDKIKNRDMICWAAMIGGLALHGHGREALQLFEEMKSKGSKPDGVLFVAVLSACSHAGLVEEGCQQFSSMKRDYDFEPGIEHYTCMVDMLGRAGRLEEAKLFILNMPIKPDKVTWTAFLGACKIHKNLELAKRAAEECLKLKPTDAAPYVLLSNVYAAVGNWDQVNWVRSMMEERSIRKDPGQCWIAVGDKIHHFWVGDTSHPETREIYAVLSSLSNKLKAEGYTADTRLVLMNIAEEDKESALCSHSEKLAIAYGLMHVAPGKPIRVYKNLRICKDCHVATKLISRITGREIVARDATRFHHFKDGSCSCGDYW